MFVKEKVKQRFSYIIKKYPRLRGVLVFQIGIMVAVYSVLKPILRNRRKIAVLAGCALLFPVMTTFAFIVSDSTDEAPAVYEQEKVLLKMDDADIETEEIDMSRFFAGEEDLEALVRETEEEPRSDDTSGASEKTAIMLDFKNAMEDDIRVYDDDIGEYVKADFKDDWSLILVNKEHPIGREYKFELGTIRGNIKSDVRIVSYVLDMIKAARNDGVILSICSPYRDYDRQVMLFNRKVRGYMRNGLTEEEAYEKASETVAIPGTSEHQIGLAFDFISNDYTLLDAGFAKTEAGKWLRKNAADYGFILRYPENKAAITEIEFEPWHYRYVGVRAAHEIMDNGLCLEEYTAKIGAVRQEQKE